MAVKHINENFMHQCGMPKVVLENYAKSIIDMGYETQQIIDLLDFYLFHAPILKSDANEDIYGSRSLRDYGWNGTADMHKLEGKLLKIAGMSVFCFIKAESIAQTLEAMDLTTTICTNHPRAVIRQNSSVSVYEDGSTSISQKETRMECLFRHIRNSLAHNRTYLFDNNNILIEDLDDNKRVSARILIPKDAFVNWMLVVKSGP